MATLVLLSMLAIPLMASFHGRFAGFLIAWALTVATIILDQIAWGEWGSDAGAAELVTWGITTFVWLLIVWACTVGVLRLTASRRRRDADRPRRGFEVIPMKASSVPVEEADKPHE